MSTEKKSEKLALYVALIASILALILTIVTYLVPPSGTLLAGFGPKMTPPPSRGPGFRGPGGPGAPGGRVMRGASPSAAILQKYDEQIRILERLYQKAEAKGKSAENAEELQAALLRLDIGRLNRMRLQKGRRGASSFADAYLAMKCAEQNWKRAEQMVKNGKLEKEKQLLHEENTQKNNEMADLKSEICGLKEKLIKAEAPVNEDALLPLGYWSCKEFPKELSSLVEDIAQNQTIKAPTKLRNVLSVISKWYSAQTERIESRSTKAGSISEC